MTLNENQQQEFSYAEAQAYAKERGFKRELIWWRKMYYLGKIGGRVVDFHGSRKTLFTKEEIDRVISEKPVLKVIISAFAFFFLFAFASLGMAQEIHIEALANSIYKAEGGIRAKKPYGILSVKCEGEKACRKVCINTIKNNIKRWERSGKKEPYFSFLARRYAPIGVANDPSGLNKNWLRNVSRFYEIEINKK